jgi:hypothetical protein
VSNVLNPREVILFSSISGAGVEEARRFIDALLRQPRSGG